MGSLAAWALAAPAVSGQAAPGVQPNAPTSEDQRAAAEQRVRAEAQAVEQATGVHVRLLEAGELPSIASGPQPPVGQGGVLYRVLPPPAVQPSSPKLLANVGGDFAWHSAQTASDVDRAFIEASGGDNNRALSVGFAQNTYRDVGIVSKTVVSTGLSQLIEVTGTAVDPKFGSIDDAEQCTGTSVSVSVGYPTAYATAVVNGNKMTAHADTGTVRNFILNYSNAFRCTVNLPLPGKITRSNAGYMQWKHGGLSPNASSPGVWS